MMAPYDRWYGGLGGYAKAETSDMPSAKILQLVRKPIVPKGWADWYQSAAEGLWA